MTLLSDNSFRLEMLERKPVKEKGSGGAGGKQKLVIVDEPVQTQKKSVCC